MCVCMSVCGCMPASAGAHRDRGIRFPEAGLTRVMSHLMWVFLGATICPVRVVRALNYWSIFLSPATPFQLHPSHIWLAAVVNNWLRASIISIFRLITFMPYQCMCEKVPGKMHCHLSCSISGTKDCLTYFVRHLSLGAHWGRKVQQLRW